jgi:L-2-hydroxyglutarate oxidase
MSPRADVIVAGGGIVGLAAAWRILKAHPDRKVIVLEKEAGVARHQTGHNSGVIHSGIYYAPGSYKARLCRRGYAQMREFCEAQGIPHEICGKLIVALTESELPRLETLRQRAEANGLRGVRMVEKAEIAAFEPQAAGLRALHVPETGIVDYKQVAEALAAGIKALGGEVITASNVDGLRSLPDAKIVRAGDREFSAGFFINCGGLMSDRLARLDGLDPQIDIIPFRGEYYDLSPEARPLVRNLIYPVPDPAFPFLGVHFTRMIGGGVECGPNAVLAFKREGYRKTDFNPLDLAQVFLNPGFRKLAARHWRMGLGEFHRSFSKAAFVKALQRLLPSVRDGMLTPAGAGVRAQALRRDGTLVDDFAFAEGERSLHVLNAPSPAATASLAIGEEIESRYTART